MNQGADLPERDGNKPVSSIHAFLAAIQFLTIVPPLIRRPFTAEEMGRSVGFYPLVGLLFGAILLGMNYLLGMIFPSQVRTALVLAVWVLLSGALHLDGFLDACDGLFGGFTPERRLEIMRDERLGAFALVGGVLLLIVKFSALAALAGSTGIALLLAPTLGRWGMACAVVVFPYGRLHGLGRDMKDQATIWHLILATGTAITAAWLIKGYSGIAALIVAGILALGIAAFTLKRIPGLTGDIYGAINELVEVASLLTLLAIR
jgi:adenosylcobinamide-GDP ribazoletransferase